tara:strand:- start:804 stop:1529 length:726 start_codon:yes stop_codon:yes gene_type:complete
MLDIFNVETDVEVQEERDSVGFKAWESGFYPATLKAAFLGEFGSGSRYIEIVTEIRNPETGETMNHSERETVWSANTKGAYYIDKKTKAKKQLIGLSKMNSLGELLTGNALKNSTFTNKFHTVYSAEANGQVPTELPTLVDWCGKEIYVGLQKVIANKQTKQGTKYVDIAETREFNEVNKFFDENKRSNLEVKRDTKAIFYNDWVKANANKTKDKSKAVVGAAPVAGGVPSASAAPLEFNL